MDELLDSAGAVPVGAPVGQESSPGAPIAPPSPGRPPAAVRPVGGLLIVVAAWAVLVLWGLGDMPFHTKGEPREGLVVWEMTHDGGWVLPRRNGTELPSKPPLFHWLAALTSLARGATDEWSIRFPSAALSLVGAVSVFAVGSALWTAGAGLMSALVLMTTFEWARAATNARVDMTLTVGLETAFLSLLFFLRERRAVWLVPMYLGISWAVLGKGPVGIALPGLTALVMLALLRDVTPLRQMRLGAGALAVAVLAGSWYVLALFAGGWAFFQKQVLKENVFTFLDDPSVGGGHRHSVWYLGGALLLGLLPWTLTLPSVGARLWRERRTLSAGDPRVFLLVWTLVVFAFYGIAASKRSVYLLALYPAVALLIGWWSDQRCRAADENDGWLAATLAVGAKVLAAALVPLVLVVGAEGVGVPVLSPLAGWLPAAWRSGVPRAVNIVQMAPWFLFVLLVAFGVTLVALARLASRRRWTGVFVALFVAIACGMTIARQVVVLGITRQETLRPFMATVRRTIGPSGTVFFYRTFDYEAVFYSYGRIPVYDGPWPDDAPQYVLVTRALWERIEPASRDAYTVVATSDDPARPDEGALVFLRRVGDR
jgi:4-amino-4-deoxy-L-arabinose transferase-like glycosyltransferase